MRHWKKVDELKDLGCYVRGRFYDLSWSKPVLRAPAVHGVSSMLLEIEFSERKRTNKGSRFQEECTRKGSTFSKSESLF